jgi:hypothetical protein
MPTFLNPAYLGALALAAIPILIHLIRRRRIRIIPWAAWDFLLQSRRRNRRRLRIEQLLLLLVRIAIVCLVVLAFARPILRALGLPMLAEDARVHALIVLDNSYSMGYRREGVTDFERARQVADRLIGRVLKQGDSVSLVLLSAKPDGVLKEPTFDLRKARERVRAARLSDRSTDYGACAAYCAALLRNVSTPAKEVYWITDDQKAGFPESGRDRAQAAFRQLVEQARITWINVTEPDRPNLSVEAPVFSRELITPQAPIRIEAVIHNYSDTTRDGLLVNLNVDDRPSGSARVNVPANGQAKASFLYLFEKAGVHTGTIRLAQPDSLERDNTAYFAARVRDRLKVLIVNPRPAADPSRDEAFYMATALAPTGASQGGNTAVQAIVSSGPRLAGRDLRAYDAVVITGLSDFETADRMALEDFVRNGGGLLLFPGPNTDPARVNAALGAPPLSRSGERGQGGEDTLLPARLGPRRLYPDDSALTLNAATINHPALLTFKDTNEIVLSSARYTLVYDLTPLPAGGSIENPKSKIQNPVVCRFSNGQPAFVERRFGQGKVILAAGPAGVSGGTMPYKPAYVPLIHQLVAYLAAGPTSQRNLRLGQPLSARFDVRDADKPVRLTDPSGQTSLQRTTLGAEGVTFSYANTPRAGIYRIELGTIENRKSKIENSQDAFAVNLPAGESNLASVSDRQTQAALGPVRVQFARGTDDLQTVVRASRRGVEIWRNLVLSVLPLLFLEALLAQRFGRRG